MKPNPSKMNMEISNVAETANFQSHTFVFGKRVRLSDIRSLNYFVFVTRHSF